MGIPWQGEAAVQRSSHRLYESMGNVQYLAYAITLNMLPFPLCANLMFRDFM